MDEQSIWKKEISFRRRKPPVRASGPEEGASGEPGESPESEPTTPFWKKEISFKRAAKPPVRASGPAERASGKPGDSPAPIAPAPEELPAAIELVEAYAAPPVPEAPTPAPEPSVTPQPEAPAPIELFPVPESAAQEAAPTQQLPPPQTAPPWPAPPPAVAPVPPTPTQTPSPPPQPQPQPQAFPSAPVPPVAPSTHVPAPAPVVVHPPVPAAELPPLPTEQPPKRQKKKENDDGRLPFYRRRRKPPVRASGPGEGASGEPGGSPEESEPKNQKPRRSLALPRPQRRGGKGAKRIVGLKIGASQLSAATVSNNGHAEVLQVARSPLEPGIVAGGELREPDALAEALKTFFAKHKLPKRGVRLGIATNRIGVRTLEIVGIDDPKQLTNAIRFRAQEALPIPIDEAVLDYQVLSETKNEEGETTRKILLVLAYRDLVDRYVAACRKAGITLVGIDLEAFALLRALAAPPEQGAASNAAFVAVTVGHERTTFAVSNGRVCEFTRVLDWGGATLNVALARALDTAPSEVAEIKRELTLDGTDVPEGLTAEQAHACRDALRRQVQAFARELVSSLQFYQNQPGSLGIGEIVITGGTAHLSGFAAELERLIGVRVRVGDPLVRVRVGKRFKEPEQLGSLAVAIGLGIED